jgi:hypothetical protein
MAVLRRLRRLDPFLLRAQAQIVVTSNGLKKTPLTGRFLFFRRIGPQSYRHGGGSRCGVTLWRRR